ncbi:hypothetical protein GCM10022248_06990 [Nonomuraea soli]
MAAVVTLSLWPRAIPVGGAVEAATLPWALTLRPHNPLSGPDAAACDLRRPDAPPVPPRPDDRLSDVCRALAQPAGRNERLTSIQRSSVEAARPESTAWMARA